MSLVLDASVVVPALTGAGGAGAVAREALAEGRLHAPHLLDVEVASACRGLVGRGRIGDDDARAALARLAALRLRRHQHHPLLARIWDLRHSLSAYDACYVALAEALDATLLTADRRLAAATGLRCDLRVLAA